MEESKTMIDENIIKLKQMYLEEKVNSTNQYVMLENKIYKITDKVFYNKSFHMSFPENFTDVIDEIRILKADSEQTSIIPFAVMRSGTGTMAVSFRAVQKLPEETIDISSRFVNLFSSDVIDEQGQEEAGNVVVSWFDYRQSQESRRTYNCIFSFNLKDKVIIGCLSSGLQEHERSRRLIHRLLKTIRIVEEVCI